MATAAKKTRIKSASTPVFVPQSQADVAEAIRELGEKSRELTRLQADMNDELARVKEKWETQAQPLAKRCEALHQGVHIWCEANRAALTQNGKVKTAALTTGEIAWRIRPPSCRITGVEAVKDVLRRLGLERFIRSKEEINKEAILNEPAAVSHVPGITIEQGEDFVITPFEADLAAA